MKSILLLLLVSFTNFVYSQDSCSRNDVGYSEINDRFTELYHANRSISHRMIYKGADWSKRREWNSCGQIVGKSKSWRSKIKKTPYYKRRIFEYHENGTIKMKSFSKTYGCLHIKRRWRKYYSEEGKRIDK